MTETQVAPAVDHRARRARRNLRRTLGRRYPAVELMPLSELVGIHPPARVAGDEPFGVGEPSGQPGDSRLLYYRPDGTRITGPIRVCADEWERISTDRAMCRLGRSTFHRDGRRITVSTIFLVADVTFGSYGTPELWETMVFQADAREPRHGTYGTPMGIQHRYRSSAAAVAGHRMIAAAIAGAGRSRRAARRAHPSTAPLRTYPRVPAIDRDDD